MFKQVVCDKCKHLEFRVRTSDEYEHSKGYYDCPYSEVCYFDWEEERGVGSATFKFFEKKEDK